MPLKPHNFEFVQWMEGEEKIVGGSCGWKKAINKRLELETGDGYRRILSGQVIRWRGYSVL